MKDQLNELNDIKVENHQLKGSFDAQEELGRSEEKAKQQRLAAQKDDRLEETIKSLGYDNQDLRAQVSQHQARITSLEVDKQRLQHAAAVDRARIASMEKEIDKQQIEAAQYQATITSLDNNNQDLLAQVAQHQATIKLLYLALGILAALFFLAVIGLYYIRRKLLGGRVVSNGAEENDVSGLERDVSRGGDDVPVLAAGSSSSTAEEDDKENHPPTVKKGARPTSAPPRVFEKKVHNEYNTKYSQK